MNDLPKKKQDEENKEPEDTESGYYYDDAHGYEVYCPEDDDKDEEKEVVGSPRCSRSEQIEERRENPDDSALKANLFGDF